MKFRLRLPLFAAALAALAGSLALAGTQTPDPSLVRQATETLTSKSPASIADDELSHRLTEYQRTPTVENRQALSSWLEVRHHLSGAANSPAEASAAGAVKSIKSNPLFRDAGDAQDSNWIQSVFKRLGRPRLPELNPPSANLPGLSLPPFITPLMWTLLAGLVVFFAIQVARHLQIKQRIKRKSAGLLDESEPIRSQSEWLALADRHEAAGEYREAVRCLYIAMLLTFDEHRVARFDRRQTNWEHLVRIESSPLYPAEIGFRQLTQRFDRIWYGHQTRGVDDLTEFRKALLDLSRRGSEITS